GLVISPNTWAIARVHVSGLFTSTVVVYSATNPIHYHYFNNNFFTLFQEGASWSKTLTLTLKENKSIAAQNRAFQGRCERQLWLISVPAFAEAGSKATILPQNGSFLADHFSILKFYIYIIIICMEHTFIYIIIHVSKHFFGTICIAVAVGKIYVFMDNNKSIKIN
ncbi:hypothetical protein ACJX0J_020935, partial [Zea mays]